MSAWIYSQLRTKILFLYVATADSRLYEVANFAEIPHAKHVCGDDEKENSLLTNWWFEKIERTQKHVLLQKYVANLILASQGKPMENFICGGGTDLMAVISETGEMSKRQALTYFFGGLQNQMEKMKKRVKFG